MAVAGFFEHQNLARRNTRVMVVLFLLAVVVIVAAVDLVFGAAVILATNKEPTGVFAWGALLVAAVIFVVSAASVSRLAGGGAAVAKMLGARLLPPNSADPLERRLLNVVEEMSIASGVRVPEVYVLDREKSINAFAAGWDVSSAAITVTRGTLEQLNRDELQGVIGHEFSHIVNGDMRLNLRMIGVLGGIVFVGSVGQFIMRNANALDDVRVMLPAFTLGLLVFLVGYVGLFFARLIKAAVSRQREFLADASSVQFTRNPDGIAGALDRIGASGVGTLISGRYAEELSHLYFGQGVPIWLHGLFDTHPPVEERIRRIHPQFQRIPYREKRPGAGVAEAGAIGFSAGEVTATPPLGRRVIDTGISWHRSASESANLVGVLDGVKVDYAARMLASLPVGLRELLRDPDGARGAMVALMLAPNEEVARVQMAALKQADVGALTDSVSQAAVLTRGLAPAYRLPVLDLALPAVKTLTEPARRDLVVGLEAVINADRRVTLHEFLVLMLVRNQLAVPEKPRLGERKLVEMRAEATVLLSLMAHAGARADAAGGRAEALQVSMRAGAKEMGLPEEVAAAQLSLEAACGALDALKALAPLQTARLVKGLFAAVLADGTIRVAEAELMRLVGAMLDCPLPPLLEDVSAFS